MYPIGININKTKMNKVLLFIKASYFIYSTGLYYVILIRINMVNKVQNFWLNRAELRKKTVREAQKKQVFPNIYSEKVNWLKPMKFPHHLKKS